MEIIWFKYAAYIDPIVKNELLHLPLMKRYLPCGSILVSYPSKGNSLERRITTPLAFDEPAATYCLLSLLPFGTGRVSSFRCVSCNKRIAGHSLVIILLLQNPDDLGLSSLGGVFYSYE